MRLLKKLLTLLCVFMALAQITRAQDDYDDEYDEDEYGEKVSTFNQRTPTSLVIKDFYTDLLQGSTPKVKIESITPNRGPMRGETRVEVRGGPFSVWESAYPRPKCKFGDADAVPATYSTCKEKVTSIRDQESRKKDRNFRCLACDFSPPAENVGSVAFQISLTGDFHDSVNSVEFLYFPNVKIHKIFPRYGPKDGGTPVKVWGENFISFNHTTRCSFGLTTVIADVKNSTYLECYTPFSDVVQKAMPFSIT